MTRTITALLFVFASLAGFSQGSAIQPKVDERTELLSIVFRLSGADEYVNNDLAYYAKDVDDYFAPVKEHEVVLLAKKLRQSNGVSYDAVMSMAISLDIADSIRFKENLSDQSLDKRWGNANAAEFLALLNRFYTQSKFHDFFIGHRALYSAAEGNFVHVLKEVDFTWFQKFFGEKPTDSFNLVLSLSNGGGNYGPSAKFTDGKKEIYAIMGSWQSDSLQHPIYSKRNISLIVHEFNHSFCNPLADIVYDQMEKRADEFFTLNSKVLSQQAYTGSKTLLYEILVRACVIKYYQSCGMREQRIKRSINEEKSKGFLWIEELVNSLAVYEKNRDRYPRLRDYMPEVAKLQNGLSAKQVQADFEKSCARIVSTNIENGSTEVDPATSFIALHFDRPMDIGSNGTSNGKRGEKYFPEMPEDVEPKWDETGRMEWVVPVKLKPNTEYSISFPASFFWSENGTPLKETYYLDFKTKGAVE